VARTGDIAPYVFYRADSVWLADTTLNASLLASRLIVVRSISFAGLYPRLCRCSSLADCPQPCFSSPSIPALLRVVLVISRLVQVRIMSSSASHAQVFALLQRDQPQDQLDQSFTRQRPAIFFVFFSFLFLSTGSKLESLVADPRAQDDIDRQWGMCGPATHDDSRLSRSGLSATASRPPTFRHVTCLSPLTTTVC